MTLRTLRKVFKKILSKAQNFVLVSARFVCLLRKGRGKSGGARIITANAIIAEHEGRIALLTIYDKEDASTVKLNVIKKMAHDLGFDV